MFSQEPDKATTEVRAVRIPKKVGRIIEEEARSRRITVNALIANILKRFAEFDRFSDKFGYVTIARETLQLLTQETGDAGVMRAGRKAGRTVPREIAQFWFKDLDAAAFFSFLSNLANYSRFMQYDVRVENGTYRVALHHDMGLQWSEFLQCYIGEAVGTILHATATVELSENLVLLSFTPLDGRSQKTLAYREHSVFH